MNLIDVSAAKPAAAIIQDRQDVKTRETAAEVVVRQEAADTENERQQRNVPVNTEEIIESVIERNGREVVFGGRSIEFQYDKKVGRVIVRVRSQDSGEIVRQIPRDEYLKLAAQFKELAGLLFNEKV